MPAEETAMANENGRIPEDQLGQLQTWIGTVLSSKKSKNLTRDFSDGGTHSQQQLSTREARNETFFVIIPSTDGGGPQGILPPLRRSP